ncbi:MAG: hypothetical protein KDK54_21835, partial [Leptospiraceae bacterium]|nr:hypothetical protein [Leptospiraceae bacterium]
MEKRITNTVLGGNLLKRGQYSMYYEDPNHKQSVTKIQSDQTGTLYYSYDNSGNMVSRNGDSLSYDGLGKMKELLQSGSSNKIEYTYNSSGERIKKKTGNLISYTLFNGSYEINREAGKPELHTVYIRGLKNDLLAQMTRDDAVLLSAGNDPFPFLYKYNQFKSNLQNSGFFSFQFLFSVNGKIARWMILLTLVIGYGIFKVKHELLSPTYSFTASILIVSILFTFTQCGFVSGSKGEGKEPWFLILNGVNSNTPGVSSTTQTTPNGGSVSIPIVPVKGIFFLHPDHLGSITMITDGYGNPVTGGEFGGKSYISYKPYGEILRTDSSGPDITKYKYTGQIEDKETGLMFYKARYYDPMLAR